MQVSNFDWQGFNLSTCHYNYMSEVWFVCKQLGMMTFPVIS